MLMRDYNGHTQKRQQQRKKKHYILKAATTSLRTKKIYKTTTYKQTDMRQKDREQQKNWRKSLEMESEMSHN